MLKTIGELIDELSIVNIKIFFLVDKVKKNEHTKEEAYRMDKLVTRRSQLRNAINEHFDQEQDIKV